MICVSALASSAEMPVQMLPCQPLWATHGIFAHSRTAKIYPMRLGLAILAVVILLFAIVWRADAEYFVHWEQSDEQPGDTWDIRWDCTSEPQPLVPRWNPDGTHAAVVEPELTCTGVARVWRDGEVSVESNPRVYVPEPPWLLGVLCGLTLISASPKRVRRAR